MGSQLDNLRLPLLGAPMFIASGLDLVLAQCKWGVVGSFPALNARSSAELDEWIARLGEELSAWDKANPSRPSAPFAINQIVHKTNNRLEADMEICAKYKAPIIITSLGAREEVYKEVRNWSGLTLHDVVSDRFARKAVEKGASGLVAVAAGAGGHAGVQSPFALVQEIRAWFSGPLALSGAIARGDSILAAQAMGADYAYVGSAFIATTESNVVQEYKEAIVAGCAEEIVYTDLFSGVPGNYLASSLRAAGIDPANLPNSRGEMSFASGGREMAKAWRDIWGSGQGIGVVSEVGTAAQLLSRLLDEYRAAASRLLRIGPARQ